MIKLTGFSQLMCTKHMSKKKLLTDDDRQAFIDKLPENQLNPKAEEVFEDAISRASQPKRSKPEKPVGSDNYTDIQTHSRKIEDTSG